MLHDSTFTFLGKLLDKNLEVILLNLHEKGIAIFWLDDSTSTQGI